MMESYISLSKDIVECSEFKQDYKTLFKAYISHLVGDRCEEPPRDVALRLSTSAQILVASGTNENIETGISIIDMFLELLPSYIEDLVIIAETMFSFLGNYPNIALISKRWQGRKPISLSLDSILAEEMHKHINNIESLGIDATDFQVDLWNSLQDGTDVVTIAPTSTGKSYIIMQYIVQSMLNMAGSIKTYAVYIVPSRALIYEVSRKIQNLLSEKGTDDIEVATVGQKEKEYERNTIFVLTQERMLMLLHFKPLMRFSYIVIDEAQSIAEGSRGVLLHIAISSAISRGPIQLIFSTPSKNYRNSFNFLLGNNDIEPCDTEHSPVAKNHIFVKCQQTHLVLTSKRPEIEIKIPKKFTGKSDYYKIVKRLGDKNNNIVYANRKFECDRIVRKLLTVVTTEKPELYDASDYIKKTVHEEYSLAEAIKKGIVFHYGPLPRNIRIMIENCVEEKLIDYIVCTSTLAEGVNMPAQNLFIRDPKTYSKKGTDSVKAMSSVQFRNIIGRAGRLMRHFSGNVFYVDYDEWEFPETVHEDSEDHKLPTYFKILRDNTEDIINAISGKEVSDTVDPRILNATINKLLQDRQDWGIAGVLDHYVDSNKRQKIINAIEKLIGSIDITDAILRLNPTVGIFQQNKLY
ncbi:MAG: DEAD/DEAH box helicase, partial [Deltaproteobacteria bacterium]